MSRGAAPRLLIVGFGPFPGVKVNPSGCLARRIAGAPRLRRALGGPPRCLVMETVYGAIAFQLGPALAAAPDAVLMIGLARRARVVRVETRARNRASRLFPDAGGATPGGLALEPRGPAERRSAEAPRALARLRRFGLPVRASNDAGRYLCNASYFRALAQARPTLFLHIPPPPRPGRRGARRRPALNAWAAAFAAVALDLVAAARRR